MVAETEGEGVEPWRGKGVVGEGRGWSERGGGGQRGEGGWLERGGGLAEGVVTFQSVDRCTHEC